jgi:hypothetical protein
MASVTIRNDIHIYPAERDQQNPASDVKVQALYYCESQREEYDAAAAIQAGLTALDVAPACKFLQRDSLVDALLRACIT